MSYVPLEQVAKKPSRGEVKSLEKFKNAGYRIVGSHSAVKVCHWTKSAIKGGKKCYKSWYGVESHRCVQMTPSVQYCNLMCVFCWRFHTVNRVEPYTGEWDDPKTIIDGVIAAQRQLLSGFKGNQMVDRKRFEEAMNPTNMAISLDGEPTIYPYIADLILEARRRGISTFLVTNGTMPERLEELLERDAQPTNLYISFYGPDEKTHLEVNKPLIKDSWSRIMRSLQIMSRFTCRKVIRLTLVKGVNMKDPDKYAEAIKIAKPDFVECKGYTHVGESQKRLSKQNMPTMEDLLAFSEELSRYVKLVYVTQDEVSRVVLLANPDSNYYLEQLNRLNNEESSSVAEAGPGCGEDSIFK